MRNRIYTAAGALIATAALATAAGLTATANAATQPASPARHHHGCELDGRNVVTLTFAGNTYNYPAHFESDAAGPGTEVISGWLHDGYEPVPLNLPVHGVAFQQGRHGDCDVVFSVAYPAAGPDAGNQGVRTFSGVLDHRHLSGEVSETGTEGLVAPFALVYAV